MSTSIYITNSQAVNESEPVNESGMDYRHDPTFEAFYEAVQKEAIKATLTFDSKGQTKDGLPIGILYKLWYTASFRKKWNGRATTLNVGQLIFQVAMVLSKAPQLLTARLQVIVLAWAKIKLPNLDQEMWKGLKKEIEKKLNEIQSKINKTRQARNEVKKMKRKQGRPIQENGLRDKIKQTLTERGPMTPHMLADALNQKPGAIHGQLHRMPETEVKKIGRGLYVVA